MPTLQSSSKDAISSKRKRSGCLLRLAVLAGATVVALVTDQFKPGIAGKIWTFVERLAVGVSEP